MQFDMRKISSSIFKKPVCTGLLLILSGCMGPRSCVPNFKELKTSYPHVIYFGPKKPVTIQIKKNPPASWTSLGEISKAAQWAIVVSEDWAFYQHSGIDEKQIHDAIEKSLEEGKLKRGASTITQQVVKNVYLSQRKSITRKIRELWMAKKIEQTLGKKRILEIYLNIAEMGEGIFGIGQASQFYFKKLPSQLNAKEGAFLAMLLPSPKKYSISFRQKQLTPYARKTIRSILGKLVQARVISSEERTVLWSAPLSFESIQVVKEEEGEENSADETVTDSESEDSEPTVFDSESSPPELIEESGEVPVIEESTQ